MFFFTFVLLIYSSVPKFDIYFIVFEYNELLMSIFVCNPNLHFNDVYKIMASPPTSPPPSPPPPPPPPISDASASPSAVKWTRKASRLRSLSARPAGAKRPVVHIDPATGKANSPHRKKLRTYLGIVARDKVDITYENWKEIPTAQKDLIWEDIQVFIFSYLMLSN